MVCKGTCKVVVRLKEKSDASDNAVQCVDGDQAQPRPKPVLRNTSRSGTTVTAIAMCCRGRPS